MHPAAHGGEEESPGQEAEHRHVQPDAHVPGQGGGQGGEGPAAAAQQVEEEALVETLQKVVEAPDMQECPLPSLLYGAPEGALHQPAQHVEVGGRALPAGHSPALQGHRLDTKPAGASLMPQGLKYAIFK